MAQREPAGGPRPAGIYRAGSQSRGVYITAPLSVDNLFIQNTPNLSYPGEQQPSMTEHTHTRTATPAKPKTPGDLDWFDFETRMRKLIAELLEPTVLRTQDDKAQILLLRKMNETLKKRMDDAEFVQAKAAKRMDKLEEIWTRVKDLVS